MWKRKIMFVYMIECEGGVLYTGVAKDIEKRLKKHYYKKKNGAKFTKSHQMTALKVLFQAKDKSCALKLEYLIKKLNREEKLKIISNPELVFELFDKKIERNNYEIVSNLNRDEIFKNVISLN